MYCWKCGKENDDNSYHCVSCGEVIQAVAPEPRRLEDDAGMRLLLPIGQSGLAIAASYAGLFSVLLVPAPIAILLGVLAVRDIKRNPQKHGMWRAIFGIVTGALGCIGLLWLVISTALGRGH
jgi:hypothetical protein